MADGGGGKLIKDDCIVLYPYPTMGHLISMVELGKRFLDLSTADVGGGFTVVVIVGGPASSYPTSASTSKRFRSSSRRIQPFSSFVPPIHLPLRPGSEVCSWTSSGAAMGAADKLGIPPYPFMAPPAPSSRCSSTSPPCTITRSASFKDLERGPCSNSRPAPLPAADAFPGSGRPNEGAPAKFLEMSNRVQRAAGFVVNTFDSLEPRALTALEKGACVPDCASTPPPPPCYAIGPLVAPDKGDGCPEYCLKWLDSQPRRSVVFLSFGSMIAFPPEQLREIATGLERSGHRFLWVLRSDDKNAADLNALLPVGFLDRTRGRGIVWNSWEQAAVLNQDSGWRCSSPTAGGTRC
ncbi:hypothetical protein H6P81_006925 [Aristolochia fimbriata]|uniref:Uncharacterized protein n=1 Tax=Aristolochia fimbriata TaxID=158543 RepID=A0AAV7F2F1_ARIFI|nr:hypothetical protein H6P81_006925 [Aristolochia fimbriata]